MGPRAVLIVKKIIIVMTEVAPPLGIIVLPEASGMIVPMVQILAKPGMKFGLVSLATLALPELLLFPKFVTKSVVLILYVIVRLHMYAIL